LTRAPANSFEPDDHTYALDCEIALSALVLDVARYKPLVICIDMAQLTASDSASLILRLGLIAPQQALLLAIAHASGSATPAIKQLRAIGQTTRLAALKSSEVEQWLQSAFGDVPHRARLAQWLWSRSSGNPGHLHALLRKLVHQQSVRFAGGAWILPADVSDALLADQAGDRAVARVTALDPLARAILSTLAAFHGALCQNALAEVFSMEDSRSVAEALQRLASDHLTVSSGSDYRLSHDGLRKPILDLLTLKQRQAVHAGLARVLAAQRERSNGPQAKISRLDFRDIADRTVLGYHQLRAGDDESGLASLRAGAIELTVRGHGLTLVAADLEDAVEFLRARGDPYRVYTALMTPLALAGTYADWRLSYRYGDELLDALIELTGLELARKLRGYLGSRLALCVGLVSGLLYYALFPRLRSSNTYRELFLGVIGIGSAVLAVCSVMHDEQRAQSTVEKLELLRCFPRTHVVRIAHDFQLAMADRAMGRNVESYTRLTHALAHIRSSTTRSKLPKSAVVQLEAGILSLLAQLDALRVDDNALRTLAALEGLDSPTAPQILATSRVLYHGHRGEHEQCLRALEVVDRLAAAAGSTWRYDVSMPRNLWTTYVLCEDVTGLKRGMQQLQTLAAELPVVARLRDLIEACYLSERGQTQDALQRFDAAFQRALESPDLRSCQELGAYARILRRAGQPARALELCERRLSVLEPNARPFVLSIFGLQSEQVLALAALGQRERAAQLAATLLEEQAHHDNPLLHALTHGVCAQVALASADWTLFDAQMTAMQAYVQRTQHPALFAQVQRLHETARAVRQPWSAVQAEEVEDSKASLEETELVDTRRRDRL
jgi:hypothetical protein